MFTQPPQRHDPVSCVCVRVCLSECVRLHSTRCRCNTRDCCACANKSAEPKWSSLMWRAMLADGLRFRLCRCVCVGRLVQSGACTMCFYGFNIGTIAIGLHDALGTTAYFANAFDGNDFSRTCQMVSETIVECTCTKSHSEKYAINPKYTYIDNRS